MAAAVAAPAGRCLEYPADLANGYVQKPRVVGQLSAVYRPAGHLVHPLELLRIRAALLIVSALCHNLDNYDKNYVY